MFCCWFFFNLVVECKEKLIKKNPIWEGQFGDKSILIQSSGLGTESEQEPSCADVEHLLCL